MVLIKIFGKSIQDLFTVNTCVKSKPNTDLEDLGEEVYNRDVKKRNMMVHSNQQNVNCKF